MVLHLAKGENTIRKETMLHLQWARAAICSNSIGICQQQTR